MKKTLSAAVALSVLAAPAFAANLENPLYMPKQGQMYSKTSVGVMYKVADDTTAMVAKGHDGATEFPIWRLHEDLGYGITDRLEAYAKVGYTHDGDIDRKGMHQGRVGLKYRAFEADGFAWDVYADAHLGGVSGMAGSYAANGFTYDNYSNGRWGFHVGSQVGNTWSKFTAAAFFEVLQTFGNDNNEIDVTGMTIPGTSYPVSMVGFPDEISVDLKSTTEFNAGLKSFYQIDDRWSIGAGFTFKHHEDNGVEGLTTKLNAPNPLVPNGQLTQDALVDGLLKLTEDMDDGFDEYIVSLSGSYQLTDATQITLYGEYTFDDAHQMSQNGTDVKAEMGARINVVF